MAIVESESPSVAPIHQRINRVLSGRYEAAMVRHELSIAEIRVMRLARDGQGTSEIARALDLTDAHVTDLIRSVCRRLKVETATQAILRLYELI